LKKTLKNRLKTVLRAVVRKVVLSNFDQKKTPVEN
jgi:hypothetical protein